VPVSLLLTSLETVQLLRDIVLITVLLVAFVAIFVFSILGVQLYRRLSTVLERAEGALENFETLTGQVSESIFRPLARVREATSRIRPFLSFLFGSSGPESD